MPLDEDELVLAYPLDESYVRYRPLGAFVVDGIRYRPGLRSVASSRPMIELIDDDDEWDAGARMRWDLPPLTDADFE